MPNESFSSNREKKKPQPTVINSSSEEEEDITYEEESEVHSLALDEKIESNLGNYVVLIVKEKVMSLKYVGRVDEYDDENDDYEGVFLQKINNRLHSNGPLFIVNEQDAASFASEDIILKLPSPVVVGGSAKKTIYNNLILILTYWS